MTTPLRSGSIAPRSRACRAANGILAVAVVIACAGAGTTRAEDALDIVVPPGQDAVMAAMLGLGAALPGNCGLLDGKANGGYVRAVYACPTGHVVLGLTHPSLAPAGAIFTDRFGIVLQDGAPSDELVGAVVWLVRSNEGHFSWASTARDPADG